MKRTALRKVSRQRARENRERSKLLKARRGTGPRPCDAQFDGCYGTVTDGHEVHTAGRGGSRLDLVNIADLCRWCHDLVTANSGKTGWAIRHGFVVASWDPPEAIDRAAHLRTVFHCLLSCEMDHREDS